MSDAYSEFDSSPEFINLRRSFERRQQSEFTFMLYRGALARCFLWLKVSPGLFLSDPLKYSQAWLDGNREKNSPHYLHTVITAVKRLAKVNRVLGVDWDVLELPRKVALYEDRIPSRDEVRQLLTHVSLRDRAMVLLMLSSGMRVGALHSLRLKDFEVKDGLVRVRVYGDSPADSYYTYCTLEAWDAIGQYRALRERYGEVVTGDSPLLRDAFDTRYEGSAKQVLRMNEQSYRSHVSKMFRRSGLRVGHKKRHELHGHCLRKFFKTTLQFANVDSLIVEILMGHDVGMHGPYMKVMGPSIPKMEEQYRRAIPSLTVSENLEVKQRYSVMEKDFEEREKQRVAEVKDVQLKYLMLESKVNEILSSFRKLEERASSS